MADRPQPRGCEPQPPRVVLDTNVCLDLLLFRDPRTSLLAELLEQQRLSAVTNAACRDEWHRVLDYPKLGLDPTQRAAAQDEYDRVLTSCTSAIGRSDAALPRCADPDDQIFLELAQHAGASLLLTRDAALLTLSARTLRVAGFRIVSPQALASTLRHLS